MDTTVHQPVLLQSALKFLNVKPDHWYVDATLGGAGHAQAIANQGGYVIAFDQDADAIARTREIFRQNLNSNSRVTLVHSNFARMQEELDNMNFVHPISGVLFDLGVSSDQLQTPARGFSFQHSGPLDMRMDQSAAITAAQIVNTWSQRDLAQLFLESADEHKATVIAGAIVTRRQQQPFQTTQDLAELISQVKRTRSKIHPATQVFQALRIAVNQEYPSLMAGLQSAWQVLAPGGHLVVITFHSGEDRIVKHFFNYHRAQGASLLTDKPVKADNEEISTNRRARSAKLRAVRKK